MPTPARVDTEQSDVLDSFVKRLLDCIPAFSDKTCFVSINPDPPYAVRDNTFLTVSPTGGVFPEEFTDGGGAEQCTEESGVIVTIFSRFQCNRPGDEREALSEFTRGVFRLKKQVLKAITSQDLTWGARRILRNLPRPKNSSPPDNADKDGLTKISVSFSADFDWDLS